MPANEVMKKFAKGKLHSGSVKGPVVTSAKQAIAIAASERDAERENGGTYPEKAKPRKGKDSR
jgi:hypothetical protein